MTAIPSRSSRTRPSSLNWPSSLFTLWRVQPTIEASSAWVSVARRRIAPSSSGGPASAGKPDQPRRQATGHVEEMKLLDVRRQPTQLAGQRREERIADGRFGRDQFAEPVARQDDRLGRHERGGGRGAWRAIEEGQLAEDVTVVERRQDGLLAGFRRDRDLHLAGDDDEQGVTRVAGVEDDLAAPEASRPRPAATRSRAAVSSPAKNGIRASDATSGRPASMWRILASPSSASDR